MGREHSNLLSRPVFPPYVYDGAFQGSYLTLNQGHESLAASASPAVRRPAKVLRSDNMEQLPKFEHPPLNEMLFCIYFDNLASLHAPMLGKLRELLGEKYTGLDTAPQIPPLALEPLPEPIIRLMNDPVQFPRTWFFTEDQTTLVQVQRDRIVLNWRQISEIDQYPSYDIVSEEFKRVFELFEQFVLDTAKTKLVIQALELTYINILFLGKEFKSYSDVGSVITLFNPSFQCFGSTQHLSADIRFALPDGSNLSTILQSAQRVQDGKPILRFDLLARKFGPFDPSGIWPWFDLAHEAIVTKFAHMTSSKIQKEVWGRTQ
jgi:uncharacterized protein (TIGR04255 family)